MELTADDMISAIMIGLVLAMALTGVYAVARRKASENLTFMVGLMILASSASMALAFGHARYKQETIAYTNQVKDNRLVPAGPHPNTPGHRGPPGGPEIGHFLAERFVGSADLDGDGQLSPEEAARTAERLVREEVEGETGSIDVEALGRALNRRSGRPNHFGPGGPPGGSGPGVFRTAEIIAAVNEDADGRLSPEEVQQFVRSADTTGTGSLDVRDLENTLRKRLGYRVNMAGPPSPARRSAPPVD